jgi:hypothetical protein
MIRFVLSLFVIAVAAWCVARYGGWIDISPISASVSEGILFIATVAIYVVAMRVNDPQRFTQVYLLSIVLKILVACILIVVLILIDKAHARSNVLFLFTVYVIFTIAEVVFMIQLRPRPREPKKNQNVSF